MTTADRLPRPAREELAGIEYVKIGECINDQGAKIVMRTDAREIETNIIVAGSREVAAQNSGTVDDAVGGVEPLLAEGPVQAAVGGSCVVGDDAILCQVAVEARRPLDSRLVVRDKIADLHPGLQVGCSGTVDALAFLVVRLNEPLRRVAQAR